MTSRLETKLSGGPASDFPGKPCPSRAALCPKLAVVLPGLLCLLVAVGCSSTRVTSSDRLVHENLPRPNQILVYDFAATATDVPPDSTLARQYSLAANPQTPDDIATGRKLGTEIAAQLVEEIRGTGMTAFQAGPGSVPQINDIVIRGYLVSVDEGSTAKRVAIGFGSGSSELLTAVEGLQMTAQGLRKLGSGTVNSAGNKSPGAALGAAAFIATANPAGLIVSGGMKVYGEASGRSRVEGRAKQTAKEVADVLKQRFKEQGWIE